MVDAPPEAKTDIKMNFKEWTRIRARPVFFLSPAAVRRAVTKGVNVEQVYKNANGHVDAPLGRDAIRRSLECQPTFLAKAIDIKTVINTLAPGAVLDEDIIAAAFAIPDLYATMKAKNLTCEQVAKATGYNVAVVESAKTNYRVTLDFALKAVAFVGLTVDAITITDGSRQFVKYLGTKEAPKYVFDVDNLIAAPARGHQWARSSGLAPVRPRRRSV